MRSKYSGYDNAVNVLRELRRNTLREKQQKGEISECFDLSDDFLVSHNYMPSQEDITKFEEIAQDMFIAGTFTTSEALTF